MGTLIGFTVLDLMTKKRGFNSLMRSRKFKRHILSKQWICTLPSC